jgi:aspartyl-tRNA(Asn)/glutamyl-tRNA(Gln) amidotransferase subunit B
VDYNRAGVPLLEIVSEPDLRSAEQARAYAAELRAILVAVGASDGRMEEGSLRVDANVSVRRVGDATLGTRCEVKNLNSLRSLGRAVEHEAARQVAVLLAGGAVAQETRHWREDEGRTVAMRSKEEAFDYRYFPEPDLVPVAPDAALLERARAAVPMLPAARRARLFGLLSRGGDQDPARAGAPGAQVAAVVASDLDQLVAGAVERGAEPALALARVANEAAAEPDAARRLDVEAFAHLCRMEAAGELSATQAKTVLGVLLAEGGDPAEIAAARGFAALPAGAVEEFVRSVAAAHPEEWGRWLAGEEKVAGFLVGRVMRESGGRADGKAVRAVLEAARSRA